MTTTDRIITTLCLLGMLAFAVATAVVVGGGS